MSASRRHRCSSKYNTRKVTDGACTVQGIQSMTGKRLMLRRPRNNVNG